MLEEENNNLNEPYVRLTVVKSTDQILNRIVDRMNLGIVGTRISKMGVLRSVLETFERTLDDSIVSSIRADHVDEFSVLEHLLAEARKHGGLPEELKAIVQRHLKSSDSDRKPNKKVPKPKSEDPTHASTDGSDRGN